MFFGNDTILLYKKTIIFTNKPMIGLSPTLPGFLAVMPPVDVPNATLPIVSNATAPTVS